MPKNSVLKMHSSRKYNSLLKAAMPALFFLQLFLLTTSGVFCAASLADKPRTPTDAAVNPEVLFVANTTYLDKAIELINTSKKEILISHFSWNPDTTTEKIKNAVYRAIDRGVKVRVILESTLGQNSYAIKEFKSLGIPVKTSTRQWYLHTKLIITDGENLLLGSTNLSNKSINENNETNILVKNSPELGGYYEKFFNAIWENPAAEVQSFETAETDYAIAAPNRLYHPIMKERVAAARRKIGIIAYGMKVYNGGKNEVMDFIGQLEAAAKRGVKVRVILERSNYDERLNEGNTEAAQYLVSRGIEVRFEKPETITHAKVILVDDETAGIGSANFAMSGFRYYQEANIIVKDKATVASVWDYFEKLWKVSKPLNELVPAVGGARRKPSGQQTKPSPVAAEELPE